MAFDACARRGRRDQVQLIAIEPGWARLSQAAPTASHSGAFGVKSGVKNENSACDALNPSWPN
jgi:hypothetical protein